MAGGKPQVPLILRTDPGIGLGCARFGESIVYLLFIFSIAATWCISRLPYRQRSLYK